MPHREQFDYSEKRSFGARYGFVIGIVLVAVIVAVILGKAFSGGKEAPPRRVQEMVMIKPTPPPPPPPPPPPQQQPTPQDAPKEQMMEQAPVDQADTKPEPPETPAPAMGTNVQGNGAPDGFGLSGKGGGMIGGGSGNGHANSSRFGWYANLVVKSISDALGKNPRTRNANFSVKVRIWSDLSGRVTKAKLAEPTGDLAVDDAIKNEVLVGFQLKEPPPEGMPMPIVMRLTARRPN